MYRNSEGYSDPTAGAALGRVMKETKRSGVDYAKAKSDARKARRKENGVLRKRPLAYVVSQYAGDVDRNVLTAIGCCRFLIGRGYIPVASHLLYPQILNDRDPEERRLGTQFGLALLALCEEVWVFTRNGVISDGMAAEIREAERTGKPVHYMKISN